ncbi:MAG: 3-phosphoglycerate dehydrogenase [Ruminococcaceae bacterium]|nr:3-phosphoglycerate dehydrogenase [Oscillospiraceae bacterium]
MIKILASDGMEKAAVALLREKGYEVEEQFYAPEELGAKLAEVDVLVVRSATKVRKPIIDEAKKAGKLQLVIRGGVGVDNIDVAYAEENGIKVRNTPKASSDSVAELALGHMFALARYIAVANVTMKNGEWNKKKYEGIELAGKTLGLIGMGRISQSIARKATALGMNVIYTDIFEIKGLPESYKSMSRDEVLANADFVSLHIPAAKDGKPVIGAAELALMKPTAYIINTARGGLVDEDALVEALDNGKLAGAALDVFAEEPAKNEKVLKHSKISLTPHIGGSTKEAQARIGMEIVDIIEDHFKK